MATSINKTKEKKIKELINKKLDRAQTLIQEAKELAKSINLLPQ